MSLAQLQAAIRCVLLALKDLHAANFAHTDIRWPHVIKCSNNAFCLIDLEAAVELGCKWNDAKHGPRRICWPDKILTRGKYTERSDLMLVGQMLKQPELPSLDEYLVIFLLSSCWPNQCQRRALCTMSGFSPEFRVVHNTQLSVCCLTLHSVVECVRVLHVFL